MKFSIVGAGALGSILAAHLLHAGHEVRLVARGRRAAQLAENGLRIGGICKLTMPCQPVLALDPAEDDGVLVYAVKTYHMDDALAAANGVKPQAVFSLANGVMKNEQLGRCFDPVDVLGCMANFSGELHDDGEVSFTRNVCLYLGGAAPVASAVADAINGAGIIAEQAADIESVEWSKYVGWIALFALSIISRATTGTFLCNRELARVAARMIREAAAIADARGIALLDRSPMPVLSIATLPFEDAVESVIATGREFLLTAPSHRMSSLQDMQAGRVLEVHETLGFACREAARLGLPATTLDSLYALAAGLNELPRE